MSFQDACQKFLVKSYSSCTLSLKIVSGIKVSGMQFEVLKYHSHVFNIVTVFRKTPSLEEILHMMTFVICATGLFHAQNYTVVVEGEFSLSLL